jgi:preprotein translocase subunit SecF
MNKYFFIKFKSVWFAFSSVLIVLGIVSMVNNYMTKGQAFNLGIDFTGGTNLLISLDETEQYHLKNQAIPDAIRIKNGNGIIQVIKDQGVKHIQLTMVDKHYFSINTSVMDHAKVDALVTDLKLKIPGLNVLEVGFIGPTVGAQLQQQAVTISLVALFLLLIYITFRFEFWAAVAAILALVHDALITLGLTSMLNIPVDSAYVAAILTILGYSINDTIVIFDRIRENARTMTESFNIIAETSIWQTVARSVYTVCTVLIVLGSIHIFGGTSLKDFSLVLLIGVSFGCYSSIFIASPLLVMFKKWSE